MTQSSLADSSAWRLTTLAGIPLRLVERTGSFVEEEATMNEVYIMKASDLMTFIDESFPPPITFGTGLFYPTRRKAPGFPVMRSARIAWEAFTPGKPVDPFSTDPLAPPGTYGEELKVMIDYSTSPVNDASGSDPNNPFTFLEIEANAGGGFYSTSIAGTSQWEAPAASTGITENNVDIKDFGTKITLTVPQVEWSIRWKQIPFGFFNATLVARLRQKLGKVNSTPMTLMFDAPAETVLFMGWTLREQFTWRPGLAGQPPMELELKFHEINFVAEDGVQVTHNHIFRPYGGDAIVGPPAVPAYRPGYRKVLIQTATGYRYTYEQADLNTIFATA